MARDVREKAATHGLSKTMFALAARRTTVVANSTGSSENRTKLIGAMDGVDIGGGCRHWTRAADCRRCWRSLTIHYSTSEIDSRFSLPRRTCALHAEADAALLSVLPCRVGSLPYIATQRRVCCTSVAPAPLRIESRCCACGNMPLTEFAIPEGRCKAECRLITATRYDVTSDESHGYIYVQRSPANLICR